MAATPTLLTNGTSTSNPGTTASISPTSGRLIELDVVASAASPETIDSGDMTPSGLSATWALVDFQLYGQRRAMWRFRCESDGTSGTISLTYNGPDFAEIGWAVKEWSGQVQGNNGADAVGTPVSGETGFDTTLALGSVGALSAGDAASAFFGIESSDNAGALEAGWTELFSQVGTNDNFRQIIGGWDDADVTASVDWTGSSSAGGIANRIIAATSSEQDITPAAITVTATPGTLSLAIGVEPDAVTVDVTPGTMALAVDIPLIGPTVTVTPGTATVSQGQPISLEPVTVTASAGTLAITTSVGIGPDPITVTVAAGTLAVTTSAAIIPADTTVSVTPGTLIVTTGALLQPDAVIVTASAGTLTINMTVPLVGPTVSVSPGVANLGLNLSLSDPGVSIAPGPVTVTQEPAVTLVGPTVSVSPSTVTVATATITRRDTMVLPIAEQLLACLCEAVNEAPNPPASCCLRPGTNVAQGVSEHEDECCEGLAWVRVARVWPTGGDPGFPTVNQDAYACSPPSYGIELEMGVYRCAPTGDERNLPTCDEWTATTEQILDDAASMRRAWCCFRDTYDNSAKLVGDWDPVTVQGGCTGGKMTVSIESYCSDCTDGS